MFDEVAWGSAADWLIFLATALYLLVTYLLLRHTIRSQRSTAAEARKNKRFAQADLVAAWCTEVARFQFTKGPNAVKACHSVRGRVRNGSDLPVYEVQVMIGATWPPEGKPIEG